MKRVETSAGEIDREREREGEERRVGRMIHEPLL